VSGHSRAASAPDSMDVVIGHERQVEVDDEWKLRDVETSCGNVGRHKHTDAAGLEIGEATSPLRLALPAVDDGGFDIRAFEKLANTIGAVLGPAEDERLVSPRLRQYVDEQRALATVIDGMNAMRDGRRDGLFV
jgi:glycine/serine hydroxymethyltransferase